MFHDSQTLPPFENFAQWKLQEFQDWVPAADGLLGGVELAFVETQIRSLADLPNPRRVPCHLDYTPRNWIANGSDVGIIDFADSAPEAWLTDLVRLTFRAWKTAPALERAFMDGYRVTLSGPDVLTIKALGALANARTIVWARNHGDIARERAARVSLHDLSHDACSG
jgi:Ser/Thr protein kinase RdoA (MazF antagonist)